jgi:nucleotide-binding universal stress UspA family protein
MPARRVLIITNELIAARPDGAPEVVRKQVQEADAVCVVAPALTGRLHRWVSDIDAEYREADERVKALVGRIGSSGQDVGGQVGDEDPLQAVADALVTFPADALIIGVHHHDDTNRSERKFSKKVRDRFGLPVTEVVIGRDGNVISVTTE